VLADPGLVRASERELQQKRTGAALRRRRHLLNLPGTAKTCGGNGQGQTVARLDQAGQGFRYRGDDLQAFAVHQNEKGQAGHGQIPNPDQLLRDMAGKGRNNAGMGLDGLRLAQSRLSKATLFGQLLHRLRSGRLLGKQAALALMVPDGLGHSRLSLRNPCRNLGGADFHQQITLAHLRPDEYRQLLDEAGNPGGNSG